LLRVDVGFLLYQRADDRGVALMTASARSLVVAARG